MEIPVQTMAWYLDTLFSCMKNIYSSIAEISIYNFGRFEKNKGSH